jgi:hypothetical protein
MFDYHAYLNSPAWAEKKAHYVAISPICWVCGWRPRWPMSGLHLHHLSYANLGNELPTDLALICRIHHELIHTLAKAPAYRDFSLAELTHLVKATYLFERQRAALFKPTQQAC